MEYPVTVVLGVKKRVYHHKTFYQFGVLGGEGNGHRASETVPDEVHATQVESSEQIGDALREGFNLVTKAQGGRFLAVTKARQVGRHDTKGAAEVRHCGVPYLLRHKKTVEQQKARAVFTVRRNAQPHMLRPNILQGAWVHDGA